MYYNAFLKSSTKCKLGKFDSQKQATKTLIFTNNNCHYLSIGRCGGLVVVRQIRSERSGGEGVQREVGGFDPHSGRPVVSLSIYPPKYL